MRHQPHRSPTPGYSDQCTTITEWPGVQTQEQRPSLYAARQQIALPVPAWVDR
ncbi:hypothetical protein [Streptomyces sp. NPDC048650]|uniref:hypothetical protein n=1 Tax=Streptomyces sp. NPDC048650 TaxID=3365583 RepID=UPI00372412A1